MEYSNAQKLAAVLSDWARPALTQIATDKLSNITVIKSIQSSLVGSGLVGAKYSVASEIMPFMNNAIDTLIEPLLTTYLSQVPDDAIPQLAHSVVDTAMQQPKFSVLDGLIEFDQDDILELNDLLDKNLPVTIKAEGYKIIR